MTAGVVVTLRHVHVHVTGRSQTPRPQSPTPGPKDPSPQQGRQPLSLAAGVRGGTPGVDAGLVSGEEDHPGPTLATGLRYRNSPAPRPPHLCRDPKGPAPRAEPRRARHLPSSHPALRWDPRLPPMWGWVWWGRCLRGRRWCLEGGVSPSQRKCISERKETRVPFQPHHRLRQGCSAPELETRGSLGPAEPAERCCGRPVQRPHQAGSLTNEDSGRPLRRVCRCREA